MFFNGLQSDTTCLVDSLLRSRAQLERLDDYNSSSCLQATLVNVVLTGRKMKYAGASRTDEEQRDEKRERWELDRQERMRTAVIVQNELVFSSRGSPLFLLLLLLFFLRLN